MKPDFLTNKLTANLPLPSEAEVLQASAIIVAAPRYMGAFASVIGIDILTHWPGFANVEIGSGAAMAILEGWAVAFMFRKWRTMEANSTHWWVLLFLQFALMLALPATATPYLLSSQLGQPANEIMPFPLLVAWSFTVAAIAPLVLAAVGYADVEQKQEQKEPTKVQKQPAKVEQKEQIEGLQKPDSLYKKPATKRVKKGDFACPDCGATFAKVQGLNAHKQHCPNRIRQIEAEAATNGRVK
jgi:hypothetical protein